MRMMRKANLRIALHQATPLGLGQWIGIGDALGRADLVDLVKMSVHRVSEVLAFQLGLDLLVDVQLQGVCLPVLFHIL